jgi:hypothetical protein
MAIRSRRLNAIHAENGPRRGYTSETTLEGVDLSGL